MSGKRCRTHGAQAVMRAKRCGHLVCEACLQEQACPTCHVPFEVGGPPVFETPKRERPDDLTRL